MKYLFLLLLSNCVSIKEIRTVPHFSKGDVVQFTNKYYKNCSGIIKESFNRFDLPINEIDADSYRSQYLVILRCLNLDEEQLRIFKESELRKPRK